MMAVNVYHACIVGIFTTRLRRLFVCGPRRAKNNSSRAAFRCAMARERDRAPQIRTTVIAQNFTQITGADTGFPEGGDFTSTPPPLGHCLRDVIRPPEN